MSVKSFKEVPSLLARLDLQLKHSLLEGKPFGPLTYLNLHGTTNDDK